MWKSCDWAKPHDFDICSYYVYRLSYFGPQSPGTRAPQRPLWHFCRIFKYCFCICVTCWGSGPRARPQQSYFCQYSWSYFSYDFHISMKTSFSSLSIPTIFTTLWEARPAQPQVHWGGELPRAWRTDNIGQDNFMGVVWDFTLMAQDHPRLCDQTCTHTNLAQDPPSVCDCDG